METDVAAFARQLKQDGIDAARAEASGILDKARNPGGGDRAAGPGSGGKSPAGRRVRD